MVLVFGGAYQGKLDFVKEKFKLEDEEIFFYKSQFNDEIEKTRDTEDKTSAIPENLKIKDLIQDEIALYGIEDYVKDCTRFGIDIKTIIEEFNDNYWGEKVLIFTDISQGIVPINYIERITRENCGRLMTYLGQEADEVYRIFCGIGRRVK